MVESEVTIDMEEESAETINEIAALETLLLTAGTPVAAATDTPVAATPVAAPVAATDTPGAETPLVGVSSDIVSEEERKTPRSPKISSTPTLKPVEEDDDNDLPSDSYQTPQKEYPKRGGRGGARRTSTHKTKGPAKSPKKKTWQALLKAEVAELRDENTTLNNAINLLQETVVKQGNQIADLTSQMNKHTTENRKEVNLKISNLETRIVNFYTDQDKQCSMKKTQITSAFNKKMEKLSNKIDSVAALKVPDTPSAPELSPGVVLNKIQTDMDNLQTNIDKVEHEMAIMQDSISTLIEDSNTFSAVNPQNKPEQHKFVFGPRDPEILPSPVKSNKINSDGDERHRRSSKKHDRSNSGNDKGNQRSGDNINGRRLLKTILFMDSNSKFLLPDKLWENNTIIPCGTTYDLRKLLPSTNFDGVGLIFIHTGVNDIDTEDGNKVAENLIGIVKMIKKNLPNVKVVVSEVTPRQIHRDDEVKRCNTTLHTALDKELDVTIAKHSNLRNERWSFHIKGDDKHFAQISIARLAKNLKIAFRTALGFSTSRKNSASNRKQKYPSKKSGHSDDVTFKQKLMNFLQNC